ncbi:Aste57867_6930 [Aphanomyces stellatus]|uniref:Exonuclease 1 n=1 Tax=Aphanomyces stellatus TaxID=120398 RepID=A0A485KG49_9STRA|nr:hypothetical protein As57867_006908 [Aphanomyces stellatus]VFT83882.1 Aste57867_6930 [Aphanomyces stellatus]
MGVKDLLINLRSIFSETHISRYRGLRAGIDASGWLYKGAFACATELALAQSGNNTTASTSTHTESYEAFCLNRVELLLKYDIKPVFVFEGTAIPTKAATNAERTRLRKESLEKGLQLRDEGDIEGSDRAFKRAVKITHDMVRKFIKTLKDKHPTIECIVAPYEADAELAFLAKSAYVDFVISDDSDCIPYGCKLVLFKMNDQGQAEEFRRRHIGACEEFAFIGWSDTMFLQLCVLAGCDYCPSFPGIGFVTAYKLVKECKTPEKILAHLGQQRAESLTPEYAAAFYKAILTFRHHIVYDPRVRTARMLNPWATSKEDILPWFDDSPDFLGNLHVSDGIMQQVADGKIHPSSLIPFDSRARVSAAYRPMPIPPPVEATLPKRMGEAPLGLTQKKARVEKGGGSIHSTNTD